MTCDVALAPLVDLYLAAHKAGAGEMMALAIAGALVEDQSAQAAVYVEVLIEETWREQEFILLARLSAVRACVPRICGPGKETARMNDPDGEAIVYLMAAGLIEKHGDEVDDFVGERIDAFAQESGPERSAWLRIQGAIEVTRRNRRTCQ